MGKQIVFETKIGWLKATEEDGWIVGLDSCQEPSAEDGRGKGSPVLWKLQEELQEYMEGKRKVFTVPYRLTGGTPFQRNVWEALKTIPYGQTRSYKEIAEAVGSPKACRAVGGANHNNPIMILVPCHRVIGANGKLVGFGGGLPMKQALLDLEKKLS